MRKLRDKVPEQSIHPMNRRQLITSTVAAAASQLLPPGQKPAQAATPKKALMKLGCQSAPTSDQRLDFFVRHGVMNICGDPVDSKKQGVYSVEDLSLVKERCEKHGVTLEMVAPPFLASSHVDRTERP